MDFTSFTTSVIAKFKQSVWCSYGSSAGLKTSMSAISVTVICPRSEELSPDMAFYSWVIGLTRHLVWKYLNSEANWHRQPSTPESMSQPLVCWLQKFFQYIKLKSLPMLYLPCPTLYPVTTHCSCRSSVRRWQASQSQLHFGPVVGESGLLYRSFKYDRGG